MSDPKDIQTWIKEYKPGTPATLALTDLWLEGDDNQAAVILKAFKIGVEQGKLIASVEQGSSEPDPFEEWWNQNNARYTVVEDAAKAGWDAAMKYKIDYGEATFKEWFKGTSYALSSSAVELYLREGWDAAMKHKEEK